MFNHLINKRTIYNLDEFDKTKDRNNVWGLYTGENYIDLNIFCDASVLRLNDVFISVPGAIHVEKGQVINSITRTLYPSTNNEGEIYAILLAYGLALSVIQNNPYIYDRVNIFSDSKISVMGLRDWIFSWVKNSYSTLPILTSSSGKEVANQNIFKHIINTMVEYQIPANIYHVKGHVNMMSNKSLENSRRVFEESNGFSVHPNIISELAVANDKVDLITKKVITDNINNEIDILSKMKCTKEVDLYSPMNIEIDEETLKDYRKLIRGDKYEYK